MFCFNLIFDLYVVVVFKEICHIDDSCLTYGTTQGWGREGEGGGVCVCVHLFNCVSVLRARIKGYLSVPNQWCKTQWRLTFGFFLSPQGSHVLHTAHLSPDTGRVVCTCSVVWRSLVCSVVFVVNVPMDQHGLHLDPSPHVGPGVTERPGNPKDGLFFGWGGDGGGGCVFVWLCMDLTEPFAYSVVFSWCNAETFGRLPLCSMLASLQFCKISCLDWERKLLQFTNSAPLPPPHPPLPTKAESPPLKHHSQQTWFDAAFPYECAFVVESVATRPLLLQHSGCLIYFYTKKKNKRTASSALLP